LVTFSGPEVVGIADPAPGLAAQRAQEWSSYSHFKGAKAYTDWRAMLADAKPDAVIIGVPPAFHGGAKPNDIERACAKKQIAMFIEKPLSCLPLKEVEETGRLIKKSGVITSVGYMIRYTKVMDRAKQVLAESGVKPRHIILRYDCAYSEIRKRDWWDTKKAGGPIVEQATHFADAARYLGGEVVMNTLSAIALSPRLKLVDAPIAPDGRPSEEGVPMKRRIPRTHSAHWAFKGGCLGTLTHGLLLHKARFETDIDVWGDGLHIHIEDPYHNMRIRIRRPGSEQHEVQDFKDDDPYLTELEVFLRAVSIKDPSGIRSPYEDAIKTYGLTWAITQRARRRLAAV
jgi:predicted dehydrogenase